MKQYRDLVQHILNNGTKREDRTGVGTIGVFGYQMRFDLRERFPLVTAKKTAFKPIVEELLWFLRGETNISTLDAKIWDEWAYKAFIEKYHKDYGTHAAVPYTFAEYSKEIHDGNPYLKDSGELGPIYGKQWRSWRGIEKETSGMFWAGNKDQIEELIQNLKKNPYSRRHVVSAWNPMEIDKMALPPCHCLFQFYCAEMTIEERMAYADKHHGLYLDVKRSEMVRHLDNAGIPRIYLDLQLYQRSGDVGLGIPFNIASYALLQHLIAKECSMAVRDFVHTLGDAHIYTNHVSQLEGMLEREQLPMPDLEIVPDKFDLRTLKYEDFILHDYNSHPFIKLPVAV